MWCSQEMAFHEQVAEAQVKRYEAKIQGVEAFRVGKPLFVTSSQSGMFYSSPQYFYTIVSIYSTRSVALS